MASFVAGLNPMPSFPEYSGPYKVGTVDVELPVSGVESPSLAPDGASDIHTVLFRIFYPAVPESQGKRISWLPTPQRLHIAAYAQFLGAGTTLASVLSFLPRYLHWTSIPVHKNATLLGPPADRPRARWPTMIFSHGLGGNRNAYSHLVGSLASYGVVVICPEHRDGSGALSLVRDPKEQDHKRTRHMVPYIRVPHTQTPETWEARNKQLRIRLWELGLIFEALSAIDRGDNPIITSNLNQSTPQPALAQFTNALDILEPGRVIFSGHSFGAVTMVQLLKSTFYAAHPSVRGMSNPLFTPSTTAAITRQITPFNPTILLDMWCFPLLSASTAALYNLPLPCYSSSNPSGTNNQEKEEAGPSGSAILAIESTAFYKWTGHLHAKARILSPDPTARTVTEDMFSTATGSTHKHKKPNFFYVTSSAHLSQSDFGILFPWLTKRVFKSDRPERVLRLNVRAQLQFLRENGVVVAGTARGDLVDGGHPDLVSGEDGEGIAEDGVILEGSSEKKGRVEAWEWIDVVGMGEEGSYPSQVDIERGGREEEEAKAEEGEKEMQGEMEPSLDKTSDGEAAEGLREVGVDAK